MLKNQNEGHDKSSLNLCGQHSFSTKVLIKPNKEDQVNEILAIIKIGWAAFGQVTLVVRNKNVPERYSTYV